MMSQLSQNSNPFKPSNPAGQLADYVSASRQSPELLNWSDLSCNLWIPRFPSPLALLRAPMAVVNTGYKGRSPPELQCVHSGPESLHV